MTTDNTQLVIELIRQATEKVTQAEERICNRLGKLEDFHLETIDKQQELNDAVKVLQFQVSRLQEQTKRITKVIFTHKKKLSRRLLRLCSQVLQSQAGNSTTKSY